MLIILNFWENVCRVTSSFVAKKDHLMFTGDQSLQGNNKHGSLYIEIYTRFMSKSSQKSKKERINLNIPK